MPFLCPTCKSELLHIRVNDGTIMRRITKDGDIIIQFDTTDGFDNVICSVDDKHEIPSDLKITIIEL